MILVLFSVFILTLIIGFPIAFSLGMASFVYIVFSDIPWIIIPQKMYAGIDVFVLLCVPGFILAGNLMNNSGITERIVNFCNTIVGHIRGGLGLANVGASMLFAGISGTAVADTASLGSVMIPAMKKEGYETDFSCAVTAASSTVGPIIPPSMPMIIVGALSGLSVGKLFVAGAVPGLLLGIGLMVTSYFISIKKGHPQKSRPNISEFIKTSVGAFWAILMPIIILVGIVGGIFTPTEASVVAVIYALFVGLVIYKQLKLKRILQVLVESAITTASIMILVAFANLFAWILISEQIPQSIATLLLDLTNNKYIILILINILLLVVGTFMETIAALLILFPVLLKIALTVGIDPIQFAIICILNLIIGLTTPPVGICLFVASSIGKISIGRVSLAGLPFLTVSIIVLLLVTYIDQISLFLPNLFFN
jgi:C4-dicarboxylate transporter DctM subunit